MNDDRHPFEPPNDPVGQKALCDAIVESLGRSSISQVIALEGRFGVGKTTFARKLVKKLEIDGNKVIFADAFERDYLNDPFVFVASEIIGSISEENEFREKFIDGAKNVVGLLAGAALKGGAKLLVSTVGERWLGESGQPG